MKVFLNAHFRSHCDFYSSLKVTLLFQQNHMKKSADVPVISVLNRGGFKSVSVISSRLNDNDTVIVLAKSAGLASFIQKLKEHCAWVINFMTNVYDRFLFNKNLVIVLLLLELWNIDPSLE